MMKCFSSVHLCLTRLTVEVNGRARCLLMHTRSVTLPYSDKEGWSKGLRLCLQQRHQKHYCQITVVNVDLIPSLKVDYVCVLG